MIPPAAALVLILLVVASAGLAAYWLAVAYQIRRTVRELPTARHGVKFSETALPKDHTAWPRVCVIVPAHNEERCIADVARALATQDYPRGRLAAVFVLDRCTDHTAEILRGEAGHIEHFQVIETHDSLEGWAGKPAALWRGVTLAHAARTADYLLFLDADTIPAKECVRAGVALARHRSLPMLSLLSTLTTDQWFERTCQPVAGMEIVRQYPLRRANALTHRRPFANGQFILFERGAYEQIGGHSAVKDAVLEDVELARAATRAGLATGLFIADSVLLCRMYPDFDRFRRGWKRIFSECANRRPRRLRKIAYRMVLLGVALPVLAAACAGAGLAVTLASGDLLGVLALCAGAGALIVAIAVLAWAYRLARTPLSALATYPAGCLIVARIILEAARELSEGKPTVWGGREYAREAR